MTDEPRPIPVPDYGLTCKRCGYPLGGLTSYACPECGRPFALEEYIPRGDFPPLIANGEEVRATREVIRLLWTYQIPFIELGDPMRDVFRLTWSPGRSTPPRIGVPRQRYFEAIDLIRRMELDEPLPPAPEHSRRTTEWTCPSCGEVNPPNFEACWQCEAEAPEE